MPGAIQFAPGNLIGCRFSEGQGMQQAKTVILMSSNKANNKVRYRRVSKARILAGHPLKVSVYAVFVMSGLGAVLTGLISLLFSYIHGVNFSLAVWTLPSGILLGLFLLVLERWLGQVKEYMFPKIGKMLTAFLLFFFYLIGYLAISSLIFSYPIGYIMETFWNMPGLAVDYSLFSVNFFIVLAILSWLRNVRTEPCRCL